MDALKNVEDAIETWLTTAHRNGHPIPQPDNFITIAFPQAIPDDIRRQAEHIARQMEGLSISEQPDQNLVHAIYSQLARSAIQHAHL
jgi:hypothetical protein